MTILQQSPGQTTLAPLPWPPASLSEARRRRDAARALRLLAEERHRDAVALVAGKLTIEDHARLANGRERTEKALREEIGGFSLEAIPGPIESIPGSGESMEPTEDDLAAYWGSNHDDQFDPNDLAYWTLSNGEYYDAEATLHEVDYDGQFEWAERARVMGHLAYRTAEGGDA